MADSRIAGDFPSLSALKELGDSDLVRLLVRGQAEAMAIVFDRYYSPMMRLALRTLRNRAEAEDAVQVAFADFYRQIKRFDAEKGSLRNWLLQYVYGRCINRLKTLKRRHHDDHVELSEAPSSELATSGQRILDLNEPEVKRLVQQILGTLNEEKRRLVELVCFDGMTIREVAALMREPHARVENQYYRAIAALRVTARESEEPLRASTPKPEVMTKQNSHKLPRTLKVDQEEVEIG
jgi:RNA polymerase sigma-70 factor (ECF subfamily)